MSWRRWCEPGHPAQLVLGFSIWSIWFIAMYAGLSVVCQLAAPAPADSAGNWLNYTLWGLTLVVLALLLLLAWRGWRYCRSGQNGSGTPRFIGYVSTVLYLMAALATLVGGLPVLVLPPCI
ncbi:heme/copper-type cytochrome/quinol oxidase subunit 2 [Rheinheimera pacifica]|uniref:hypothetical protein n=1 Tax=Rheinheimera pacifica TaxID=173990 RepID=UPI00286004EB|nr:hypothetical protein [Rheinheimera pacifica]MDR6982532.1 heme/copper-type cytochrome/quinol oxidase subunit 2 [Rheinheimera pacifica]